MKNYCVLAPAGNVQALQCAVNNGADSVYLGLDKFNARMKADNFTESNLSEWVDYCHLYGVKVYVTVNTSLKQCEFDDAVRLVHRIYDSNADGVIVTDLALMKYCRDVLKGMEIVASTQLNIHDGYGARFVKELGATTVVMSRESTYEMIADVAKQGVEVESFIHGALCVCQSGQCLMSSMAGGNSGNRGLCAQPCRRLYGCTHNGRNKRGYLLSAKDMCGASVSDKLLKAGATVFKIEGRNRRPQYAGETSAVYSEVFKTGKFTRRQLDRLKTVYNRGDYISDTYLRGDNSDIIYSAVQGHMGLYAGKTDGNGVLVSHLDIGKGDGFKLLRKGKECGGATAVAVVGSKVRLSGDAVACADAYLTTSVSQSDRVERAVRKRVVSFDFTALVGEPVQLCADCDGTKVTVTGEVAQKALKNAISQDEIRQQLCKTGDSCFTITDIVIKSDDVFLPKSVLNALRRTCLEQLRQRIIVDYNNRLARKHCEYKKVKSDICGKMSCNTMVFCRDEEQLRQAVLQGADICVAVVERLNEDAVKRFLDVKREKLFFDLPPFADLDYIAEILPPDSGVCVHNVGGVQFARESGRPYICGQGMNIYNLYGDVFADCTAFVYSLELTLREIGSILNDKGYIFVDGRPVLMRFVHCPLKNTFHATCAKCDFSPLTYTDELGNNFVIDRRRDKICTFDLSNKKKMYVAHRVNTPYNFALDYDSGALCYYKALCRGAHIVYEYDRPYITGRLFDKVN